MEVIVAKNKVTKFGNSAHLIMPKDFIGKMVRMEVIENHSPPTKPDNWSETGGSRTDSACCEDTKGDTIQGGCREKFCMDCGNNLYHAALCQMGVSGKISCGDKKDFHDMKAGGEFGLVKETCYDKYKKEKFAFAKKGESNG